jgi:type II secretory pathway pseudopilin PulG
MGSLRTRLALAVSLIALAALAIVALGVLVALGDSLQEQRLDQLRSQAQRYSGAVDRAIDRGASASRIDMLVRDAADRATARVTLFGVARTPKGVQTYVKSDSTREVEIRDLQFEVAVEAARTNRLATGTEAGDAGAATGNPGSGTTGAAAGTPPGGRTTGRQRQST